MGIEPTSEAWARAGELSFQFRAMNGSAHKPAIPQITVQKSGNSDSKCTLAQFHTILGKVLATPIDSATVPELSLKSFQFGAFPGATVQMWVLSKSNEINPFATTYDWLHRGAGMLISIPNRLVRDFIRLAKCRFSTQILVLVWCQFWCSLAQYRADSNFLDLINFQLLTLSCGMVQERSRGL